MKIKAPGHKVMLKPRPVKKTTDSGIVLAVDETTEKATTTIGTVVDIGPDAWKTMYISGYVGKPWANIGDEVYIPKYGAKWVVDESTQEEYMIINDEDVVCVIPKGDLNG